MVDSPKVYFVVYVALLILLALTVGAAALDLGALNTAVALLIAALKAGLIVAYFMHVHNSSRLVRLFAAAGFFWVLILILLTLSDFLTRFWVPG
ncbi:MAG: cytochrome C oxidase subunit IV family protein [Anaerolineales bacterium]|nr:cytochrome C oxidase subunit IV family protein [Anaerolineales bacterium]